MIQRIRDRINGLVALVVLLYLVGLANPERSPARRALGAELLGERPESDAP